MITTSPQLTALLQNASRALSAGAPDEALRRLAPALEQHRPWPDGLALAARARLRLGDLEGAGAHLSEGLQAAPDHPGLLHAWSDLALARGEPDRAEDGLRRGMRAAPGDVALAVALANLLSQRGRPEDALAALAPLAARPAPPHAVLAAQAAALKAAGRIEEALGLNRAAEERFTGSPVAHHNLAATLGDLMRYPEAETSARRALLLGGGAAETHLVLARALRGQNRLDAAEAALEDAVARNPYYADAQRELAELVWMRTEDVLLAGRRLEPALTAAPWATELAEIKANLLRYSGDVAGALAAAEAGLRAAPGDRALHMAASNYAGLLDRRAEALDHARAAVELSPDDPAALAMLCEACLASGEPVLARDIAVRRLLVREPHHQGALAYLATAQRLLGEEGYGDLYAYEDLVRSAYLDVPEGWPDLGAYLADLALALRREHPFRTHPIGQSVRHGSQASYLQASDDPAIQAFPKAVDGPIRRYISALGGGADPVRARTAPEYALSGIWSVRLRSGGFHADHIHPLGWLSSACYIEVPDPLLEDGERAGWLQFGKPGVKTLPELGPERFVEPKPGLLVLFPSYMWHGTIPFTGPGHRLTVAFDVVPLAS